MSDKSYVWNPEILLALIKKEGISKKKIADKAGIKYASLINCTETANLHTPSINTIICLADYFNVSVDYLLGRPSDAVEAHEDTAEAHKDKKIDYSIYIYPDNIIHIILENTDPVSEDQEKAFVLAFSKLPKHLQAVLFLYYHDGLNQKEIAEKRQISKERARQLLKQGVNILKTQYHDLIKTGISNYIQQQREQAMSSSAIADENLIIEKATQIEDRSKELLNKLEKLKQVEKAIHSVESLFEIITDYFNNKGTAYDISDLIVRSSEERPYGGINTKTEELELSNRASNCILRAGLYTTDTIYELARTKGLYVVRNMGRKSVDEVVRNLKYLGYSFADFDPYYGHPEYKKTLEIPSNIDKTNFESHDDADSEPEIDESEFVEYDLEDDTLISETDEQIQPENDETSHIQNSSNLPDIPNYTSMKPTEKKWVSDALSRLLKHTDSEE